VTYYECYFYRADGTVCGASPLLRSDDRAARDMARHIFAQRGDAERYELWQDDRQVDIGRSEWRAA
jgi:hypothetical protein